MPLKPSDWHKRFALQAGWTSDTRRYLFDLAGIPNATSVLDVGCGTGVLTAEIAQKGIQLPVGIDIRIQYAQLAAAHVPEGHFIISDAHHMPFKRHTFDASFCHYVLMWVEKPLQVLIQIVQATKPGAAVLALAEPDYGGRIDYPPELEIISEWQTRSLKEQGADPHLGRKLKSLFSQAGLVNIEVGVIGAQWKKSPSPQDLESEWDIIQHDLRYLGKNNSDLQKRSEEIRNIDFSSWSTGERTLYVPTFYAVGRTPIN